ncbi:MAG: hypothetical protein SXG53_27580 [Pseudomonadota bacterium]|nr:hypothetical protein [Pseudomonadota bacterium]
MNWRSPIDSLARICSKPWHEIFRGLLLGLGCFIALFAWAEFSNWDGEIARVESSLIRTSEALVRHANGGLR